MSVSTEKDEVRGGGGGEPTVSVPIKKRPILLPEHASPPMKPSHLVTGLPFSALCGNQSYLNLCKSDANLAIRGNETVLFRHRDTVSKACEKSGRGSLAEKPSSLVKEVKVGLVLSGFPFAEPSMAVPPMSDPKVCSNMNIAQLPLFDLNVPPSDSIIDFPVMHTTVQNQMSEACLVAPTSTIGSGVSVNSNSIPSLSNIVGPSKKHGVAGVTLDLQLKPPSRPELGISWKGLGPDPELSLSLFRKHIGPPPTAPSPPNTVIKVECFEDGSKESTARVPKPASEKPPVGKIAKHCTTISSVVSGNKETLSDSVVKKEQPDEPSQEQVEKDIAGAPPLEKGSSETVGNCPKLDRIASVPQVSARVGFKMNSDIHQYDNRIYAVCSNSGTIPTNSSGDVIAPNTKSIGHEVDKLPKCKENTSHIPSALVTKASDQAFLSIEKPLPLDGPTGESCAAVGQLSSAITKLESILTSDGMSQGSAEMNCSVDHRNTASPIPVADMRDIDSFSNSQTIEDGKQTNSLSTKHLSKKDTQQESVSLSTITRSHADEPDDSKCNGEFCVNAESKEQPLATSDTPTMANPSDDFTYDVKIAARSSSTNLQKPSDLEASTSSPNMELTKESHKTSDNRSPNGKGVVATKSVHGTASQEGDKESNSPLTNLAPASVSPLDGNAYVNGLASDKLEYETFKPISFRPVSLQNEREAQVDRSDQQVYASVNRNARWDGRFFKSEQEKNNEVYHGGSHPSNMGNSRRPNHHWCGHDAGHHGHPKKFQGSRMANDDLTIGRRRPTKGEVAYPPQLSCRQQSPLMHNQIPHRVMGEMNPGKFPGREIPGSVLPEHEQMEYLPDDMIEDRLFAPHPHLQCGRGIHVHIHRKRSHSPVQRGGSPLHFHQGRLPDFLNGHVEVMHRSQPPTRTNRPPRLPHRQRMNVHHHGSHFDQVPNDGRGMQRNMRRFGMIGPHDAVDRDGFEPHLHPSQLTELHAEAELMERMMFEERRAFLPSFEQDAFMNGEEMLPYPIKGDMVLADGGGPRELEGRPRKRFGNRRRDFREQDDGYRYRGPHGWRDGNSNGGILKRRRY